MKKSIFAVFLILAVGASASFAQTKKRTVKRTTTKTTKKTTKKKELVGLPMNLNPVATQTSSGLIYLITKKGNGAQLKAGDNIIVHYTGMFTNGEKFDSSRDRGEPLSFALGTGRVIKGWDEGLQKLRVGDHATFIIPSSLAYGKDGFAGAIPPDATLIFVIEVVGVK